MSSLQLRARAALRKGHGRWLIPPWIAPAFLFCAIVLLPWTAFLFFALPRHYVANHWQFAWGGFDIGLGLALAATAVAVARRSPFAEVTAAGHRDAARLRRVVRCPHLSRNERRRSGRGRGSARRASDCRVVFLDGNEPRARSRGRAPLPPGGRIHDRRESSRPAAGRHGTVTESNTTSRTAPGRAHFACALSGGAQDELWLDVEPGQGASRSVSRRGRLSAPAAVPGRAGSDQPSWSDGTRTGALPQSESEAEELLADDPTPRRPSRPTGLRLVDGLDAVVADVAVDRLLHAACGGFARHGKRRNSSASAWVPDSP
jgi:hypothetical protein